jgi:hypothetical protein
LDDAWLKLVKSPFNQWTEAQNPSRDTSGPTNLTGNPACAPNRHHGAVCCWVLASRSLLSESALAVMQVRDSGIRDPGRDRGRLWKVRTLDRDSGDPGLPAGAPLGRYSGCSHGTQDQKSARHAPGISLGVFRECRGECEEEEAEQVQPLRRAVVGHRRSSHFTWALTGKKPWNANFFEANGGAAAR